MVERVELPVSEAGFEQSRYVFQGGTTRPVVLTTGERVSFAPEALESILGQVRSKFIPMTFEHLSMLPPMGRINDGEIRTADDGHQELNLFGIPLDHYSANVDIDDPFSPRDVEGVPMPSLSASLEAESRNYEKEDWDVAIEDAPLPLKEVSKWSSLPPLEWLIAVPVTWGAAKYFGSFLTELGKDNAQSLISWIRDKSRRAKEAERKRYVTLALQLDDGRMVLGFLPFDAEDDELASVEGGLTEAAYLASVAGAQRDGVTRRAERIAYVYHDGEWELAWFVTEEGVYRTKFYDEHLPSVGEYLGLPPVQADPPGEIS